MSQVFPALNTLTASPWTLLLARLFGQKIMTYDGNVWITARRWRGKLYLTNISNH